jgi:hypothetical protein
MGVYFLPLLKHWDCGFESHSGNGLRLRIFPSLGSAQHRKETCQVASWVEWLVAGYRGGPGLIPN